MPPSANSDQHLNRTAAAVQLPHDHVRDWVHELQRLTATADSLSPAACLAVIATIDSFAAEDGPLPPPAAQARTLLAATLAEPDTNTSLPPMTEALFAALKQTLQRNPSPQQIQAA